MAVYKRNVETDITTNVSKGNTKQEVVTKVKEAKVALGLEVSPCMKDNLNIAKESQGDN